MPDWGRSMNQTYEYYIVNPLTWKNEKQIDKVISAKLVRDAENDTLGSASFDCDEDLSDKYIRTYLVTMQDGIKERIALGTYLCQSPTMSFDGKRTNISQDAYTPLIELGETPPPIGYSLLTGDKIMEMAARLAREHMRAPVVPANSEKTLQTDFVSDINDTWLAFLKDLIANADYRFDIDPLGQILFEPIIETKKMQPVFTYTDDNSSILYPDISLERDLYGVPNVVEVVYSGNEGKLYSRVSNDDPDSITSTVNRGREVVYRETNPSVAAGLTQGQLDEYAEKLLSNMSSLEYTLTYTHGYCDVRVGDCVMLNYERANVTRLKAKVIRQTITCEPGCPVEETAVFTRNLWR